MESNKVLEEYEKRKREMNKSEYEICLDLSKDWPELCPDDPNGEQLAKFTYRIRVVYGKQYVWVDECKSIVERTAVRLLRRLSDQMKLDGLNKFNFRVGGEEII